MARRILILGGTGEARALSGRLAARPDLKVTLSLAGRTLHPLPQPVPVRIGGFGGAAGLAGFLLTERIDALVDATHPYAARISHHAAEAAREAGVPLMALHRAAWLAGPGDQWHEVADVPAAIGALGAAPRRVFLALGRQEVAGFQAAPQHDYLIRSVDPISPPLDLPRMRSIVARGPFDAEAECAMLEAHRTELIVCKNSGGDATRGKLAAARQLGLRVILLARPALPEVPWRQSIEEVVAWLDHGAQLRGA